MKRIHVLLVIGTFLLGVVVGIAATAGSKVDKMMYVGQNPKDAALGLLTAALKQAGDRAGDLPFHRTFPSASASPAS